MRVEEEETGSEDLRRTVPCSAASRFDDDVQSRHGRAARDDRHSSAWPGNDRRLGYSILQKDARASSDHTCR